MTRLNPYCDADYVMNLKRRFEQRKQELNQEVLKDETKRDFYHEKNERTAKALEERIKRSLAITDVCLDEVEEPATEEEELPEFTDEMAAVVEDAWTAPQTKVLIDKFRIEIRRKDVETLKGLSWLNDEVSKCFS